MSDSTIHEIECFHLEGMSDTPSELRVVVDKSCETTLISNDLPSTASVFPHDVLGSMDQEVPSLEMMIPPTKKMYMVDEDDAIPIHDEEVAHMEANATITPTSYQRYEQGKNKGVDDAMIPLVDMMTCDDWHAMDDVCDITYASLIFPCDTLPLHNVEHVKLFDCDDVAIVMPCSKRYVDDIIACTLLNNCSFQCFACNDVTNGTPRTMLCHECFTISPFFAISLIIALSLVLLATIILIWFILR